MVDDEGYIQFLRPEPLQQPDSGPAAEQGVSVEASTSSVRGMKAEGRRTFEASTSAISETKKVFCTIETHLFHFSAVCVMVAGLWMLLDDIKDTKPALLK